MKSKAYIVDTFEAVKLQVGPVFYKYFYSGKFMAISVPTFLWPAPVVRLLLISDQELKKHSCCRHDDILRLI
jgi:hypothetical protein